MMDEAEVRMEILRQRHDMEMKRIRENDARASSLYRLIFWMNRESPSTEGYGNDG